MKRITVPEPKIELYKDGFNKQNGERLDKLERKETGRKLSELVERIDEPLVIALDGAWGSGKSFFLKCWVGYHLQQEAHKAETVYFDAFKHDYLDDPLIALTGEIARRFRTEEDETEDAKSAQKDARVKKLKKSAWAVGKAVGRIGLSAVTFGATEILSDMGDEIAKAVGDEAKAFLNNAGGEEESEKYWDMHEAKIAAMEGFRLALEALTEPVTERQAAESEGRLEKGDPTRKLVIVVDELDRCRPDYALSMLEIIKHFFNVPGVHFVLGVNLKELQNSVRARYGAEVNAAKYLRKFVSLSLSLPTSENVRARKEVISKYFDYVLNALNHTEKDEAGLLRVLIEDFSPYEISLRDVGHLATNLVIATKCDQKWDSQGYRISKACATILYTLHPNLFRRIIDNRFEFSELCHVFGIPEKLPENADRRVESVWFALAICSGQTPNTSIDSLGIRSDNLISNNSHEYLAQIARHHFGHISIEFDER